MERDFGCCIDAYHRVHIEYIYRGFSSRAETGGVHTHTLARVLHNIIVRAAITLGSRIQPHTRATRRVITVKIYRLKLQRARQTLVSPVAVKYNVNFRPLASRIRTAYYFYRENTARNAYVFVLFFFRIIRSRCHALFNDPRVFGATGELRLQSS